MSERAAYHPPTETQLHLETHGAGEPVLFLHGTGGDRTSWARQRPLADAYQLVLVDRRGYGESPARTFAYGLAEESAELATLLTELVHLVGQSYGAVLALLIAAQRPDHILSLTVSEPPAFAVARGHPDVDWLVERLTPIFRDAPKLTPEQYDAAFDAAVGMPHDPIPPPAGRQKNLDAERMEQAPWLASINLDAIASALFPTLVIAGGWGDEGDVPLARSGRAFAAVCDVLARHLHAEHAVIAGAGHAIPRTGQPYNDRLCAFLTRAGRNRLPL